jgi:2'-5' RNA ligase
MYNNKNMLHRLFAAINLPDEIKNVLKEIQTKLKKENRRVAIKWVEPEIIHLTIHFFGEIPETKMQDVKTILKEASRGIKPITLVLSSLGGFPNLSQPRVIWVGLKEINSKELPKLLSQLQTALIKNGFPRETRPWQPHLTLGRLPYPQTCHGLNLSIPQLTFTANSFELMESELRPEGPKYTTLQTFPFLS